MNQVGFNWTLKKQRAVTRPEGSLLAVSETAEQERSELMVQVINRGLLQPACAIPLEDAKMVCELAGIVMACREVGERDEPHTLPDGEGPPELERARKRRELQSYLQRMDPKTEAMRWASIKPWAVRW